MRNPGARRENQLLGFLGVPLLEAFHAAGRVHELRGAGEERMALRADADVHLLVGGAGLDDVATRAADAGVYVFRMNFSFHVSCPSKGRHSTEAALRVQAVFITT